jgi:hypothetical protein
MCGSEDFLQKGMDYVMESLETSIQCWLYLIMANVNIERESTNSAVFQSVSS